MSVITSTVVVLVLRRTMTILLTDLTGSKERASFWIIFSSILLILIPIVAGMFFYPEMNNDQLFIIHIISQLKWSLVGLICTLISMAFFLVFFIQSLSIEERRPDLKDK